MLYYNSIKGIRNRNGKEKRPFYNMDLGYPLQLISILKWVLRVGKWVSCIILSHVENFTHV